MTLPSTLSVRHTPGPWRWSYSGPVMRGYTQPFAIANEQGGQLVAGEFGDVVGGEAQAQANASLIAVAPELLQLAERIATHFENTDAKLGIDARTILWKAGAR